MKQEKYGFVYIWRDRKHNRYYIGCHWGTEDDGYICSSPWMKQGYKHRPEDFKRRILSRIYTNRKDLIDKEYKWLELIKEEELSKKYYNMNNHHHGHWTQNEQKRMSIGEKISKSHKSNPQFGKWNKGLTRSDETKKKISETVKKQWEDLSPEQKQIRVVNLLNTPWNKGLSGVFKHSDETKEKIRKTSLGRPGTKRFGKENSFYGKSHSDETKKKISESNKGKTFKHSDETKEKLSKMKKGIPLSEEHKAALRLAKQRKNI